MSLAKSRIVSEGIMGNILWSEIAIECFNKIKYYGPFKHRYYLLEQRIDSSIRIYNLRAYTDTPENQLIIFGHSLAGYNKQWYPTSNSTTIISFVARIKNNILETEEPILYEYYTFDNEEGGIIPDENISTGVYKNRGNTDTVQLELLMIK